MLTSNIISLQSFAFQTLDIDEMPIAFNEWEMDIVQTESGSFQGELLLSKDQHDEIYFYSARVNKRCYAKGHHLNDLIIFHIIYPGSGSIFNGEAANGLRLFCNTQERGVATNAGPGFVSFSVGIKLSLLNEWLEEEKINAPDSWNFHIDYSKHSNRTYIESYCRLIQRSLQIGEISVSQLKYMIICLLTESRGSGIISPAPNYHSIKLITEYIKEKVSINENITLEELVRENGGTQRTFFYSFKKYTGLSPMKFVKNFQLTIIHNRLKQANPLYTNVTDIAQEMGFNHMGQFSQDFKRLFGTNPASILGKKRYMS